MTPTPGGRDPLENVALSIEELERVRDICAAVPGWSDARHFAFFRNLLEDAWATSMFVAGVYQGRDLAFILEILATRHPDRWFTIHAADLFSSEPCADWPPHLRSKSWEAAGFGEPPSILKAEANLAPYIARCASRVRVQLHKGNSVDVMRQLSGKFDVVYLDTSHDEKTVRDEIDAAAGILRCPGVICGDDYSDSGTWGVARAVRSRFNAHHVFANWLWWARVTSPEAFNLPRPDAPPPSTP